MYKDFRYINAGENEFYRWGKKAQAIIEHSLTPNENGFLSIIADGGRYYTIGTSEGKFGEFAKFGNEFLSVNKNGYVWAKVGTPKELVFIKMIKKLIEDMQKRLKEDGMNDED